MRHLQRFGAQCVSSLQYTRTLYISYPHHVSLSAVIIILLAWLLLRRCRPRHRMSSRLLRCSRPAFPPLPPPFLLCIVHTLPPDEFYFPPFCHSGDSVHLLPRHSTTGKSFFSFPTGPAPSLKTAVSFFVIAFIGSCRRASTPTQSLNLRHTFKCFSSLLGARRGDGVAA